MGDMNYIGAIVKVLETPKKKFMKILIHLLLQFRVQVTSNS